MKPVEGSLPHADGHSFDALLSSQMLFCSAFHANSLFQKNIRPKVLKFGLTCFKVAVFERFCELLPEGCQSEMCPFRERHLNTCSLHMRALSDSPVFLYELVIDLGSWFTVACWILHEIGPFRAGRRVLQLCRWCVDLSNENLNQETDTNFDA